MLTRIKERPRRPREAHAPDIKIGEARAALVEDVVEPWQLALTSARVALLHKTVDNIIRQAIALDGNDALCLGKGNSRRQKNKQYAERNHSPGANRLRQF